MNTRQLQLQYAAHRLRHNHPHPLLSRRQFVKGGLAAAAALAAGARLWQPERALASPPAGANADPRPIPYGTQFLGPGTELFHVEAPGYPGFGAPEPLDSRYAKRLLKSTGDKISPKFSGINDVSDSRRS